MSNNTLGTAVDISFKINRMEQKILLQKHWKSQKDVQQERKKIEAKIIKKYLKVQYNLIFILRKINK